MWDRMIEKRNEGGFTLIELLIVIIILAILAAIVVFAVGTTGSNAVAASCNADAKTFETALESYKAEVGAYPGAAALNTSAPNVPEETDGNSWPNAIAAPTASLPNPTGAVFGLLGDTGTDADGQSVSTAPPGPPVGAVGTWIVPSTNAVVGPLLRELPSGSAKQHYQVWTDGSGNVYVVKPATTANPNPPPTSEFTNGATGSNYDQDPGICGTFQ
jgi:general secretion pathway protein G